jgi:hypothetical protein
MEANSDNLDQEEFPPSAASSLAGRIHRLAFIAIWMIAAPFPIRSLFVGVKLPKVSILLVPLHQVAPVIPLFIAIPIMPVIAIAIVYPHPRCTAYVPQGGEERSCHKHPSE